MILVYIIFWALVWAIVAAALGPSRRWKSDSAAMWGFLLGPIGVLVVLTSPSPEESKRIADNRKRIERERIEAERVQRAARAKENKEIRRFKAKLKSIKA
jgi:hypothetical protein